MTTFIYDQLIEAIGWAVVHSIWQGLIILIIVLILQLLARQNPAIKFRIAFTGLCILFISVVVTFLVSIPKLNLIEYAALPSENISHIELFEENTATSLTLIQIVQNNIDYIAFVWLIGFTLLLIKLILGYIHIRRIRIRGIDITELNIRKRIDNACKRIGLDRASNIKWSALTPGPMVVGTLKPCVLLPIAAINHIDPDDLELIIAHELAHLKRLDQLTLFIQQVIESFLYFNPAVWFMSRQLNKFREEACDDMVVKSYNNNIHYAKSLVNIQEMVHGIKQLQAGLNATGNKNHFLNRIYRILNIENKKQLNMGRLIIISLLPLILILASFYSSAKHDKQLIVQESNQQIEIEVANDHFLLIDTIPQKKKRVIEKVIKKENGKSYEIEYENDKLKSLKVDGKEIPQEDQSEYEDIISEMQGEIQKEDGKHIIKKKYKIKKGNEEDEEVIIIDGDDMEFDFDFEWTEDLQKNLDEIDVFKDSMIIMKFKGLGDDDIQIHKFKHFEWDNEHFNDAMGDFQLRFENGGGLREKLSEAMKNLQNFREEGMQEDIDKAMKQLEQALKNLPEVGFGDDEIIIKHPRFFYHMDKDHPDNFRELKEKQFREEMEREIRLQQKELKMQRHHMDEQIEEELRRMHEHNKQKEIHLFSDDDEMEHRLLHIKRFSSIEDLIEHELMKDGFIQEGDAYTFLLKSGKLKINGKKQPSGIYERYRRLYEDHSGIDLDSGSIIKLSTK